MMVSGKMIKDMARESILMLRGVCFKDIGRMDINMAGDSLNFISKITILMTEIIRKTLGMALVNIHIPMAMSI